MKIFHFYGKIQPCSIFILIFMLNKNNIYKNLKDIIVTILYILSFFIALFATIYLFIYITYLNIGLVYKLVVYFIVLVSFTNILVKIINSGSR